MYIDSHAHLSGDELFAKAETLIQNAKDAHVSKIINICTDVRSFDRGLELARSHPAIIYNTAATTPHDVESEGASFFPLVEKNLDQLVAIGETGLDHHYQHSDRKVQENFFRRYCALAKDSKLPLVIHCREAFPDLFKITDQCYRDLPLLLHCFTGTEEEAREVVARGWLLSLSGIVTFKNSHALQNVARDMPLSQMVIETDAPYLAPVPHRGKENEPAFVVDTARAIAASRGIQVEELAAATSANAIQFFLKKNL